MAVLARKETRLTQVSPGVHQPESWAAEGAGALAVDAQWHSK